MTPLNFAASTTRKTCAAFIASTCSPIYSAGFCSCGNGDALAREGRIVAEHFDSATLAAAAFAQHAARKARRGYS